ncbi:proteinase-activated receptor 4 [Chanos chanos]|uniref:Proteinase-activated receptor 4 n=1 Tax=Chanos chanos TaxID=29144 RepID=A0A6J2WBR6_CHACN|nr:proteinase-activated receptor 4 [Chanos chanos]
MALPVFSRALFLLLFLFPITHQSSPSSEEECSRTSGRQRSFKLVTDGCNFTLNEKQKVEIQASTTVLVVPFLYLVAFIVGLPANLLALWVLLFRTKKMPSTILLINLTSCDLMLLLVLPFRIVYHFSGNDWSFGEAFCRMITALFYGNMYGSVLCLMLIAMDRYVALVHPFGAKTFRSQRTSFFMSLSVWVVVAAAMAPLLASRQSYLLNEPPITTCHDALPAEEQEKFFMPYFITLFSVFFLLPLVLILFCYGAVVYTLVTGGRRFAHAIGVTVLVLLVFIVCLLPSNLLLLLHYSDSYLTGDGDDLYVPYMISLAVSTFNSCFDPFIFYYVSEDFRGKVRQALCCQKASADSSSGHQASYSGTKVTLLSKSIRTTGSTENVEA